MKLRRLLCFLLVLSLFICGAYSALPCGHVAAAEVGKLEYNGVLFPDINTVWTDHVTYPYAFIYQDPLRTYLYYTDNPFYFEPSPSSFSPGRYMYSNKGGRYYYYTLSSDKSSWIYTDWDWCDNGDMVTNNIYLLLWISFDVYHIDGSLFLSTSDPVDPNAPPSCPNTDVNCDNICDDCGELLPMEYWSTALEYLITAGYNLIDPSPDVGDQSPLDYFCILYNKKDKAPELIVGETKFEINTSGDVLLTKNPQLYKLFEWEDGSFSHYNYDDVSHTSDGLYLDPTQYVHNDSIRVLYSNHNINNRFVYNPDYDPFGGGTTVGGGEGRDQVGRFDIDINTYEAVGGLPADPEYGSGRVDVVVSPSAPPVSVPISPTSPVPTPDPSDPVVTPSPDPSEPNSIIIQNQITNIGENIAALPEKLGDKIAGAIKGLFVPSENDFIAIRLKWNLLLEERFGAVYESTGIIDSIVDTFQYSGDMSSIKFPSVTVDLAGTPFTFGGWDVEVIPDGFKFLVSSVKLIVSIVCTVLFVNAMRKKLEGLLNR